MTILRRQHNSNFTIVPNAIFEDKRLSVEAKGTVGYLLSRPPDWAVRLAQIGNMLGMGRDKTERVFQELRAAGYVVRAPQRRTAEGQWGPAEFLVLDDPRNVPALDLELPATAGSAPPFPDPPPCPEEPLTAEPSAVQPHAVSQGTYKVTSLSRERDSRPRESTPLVSTEALQVTEDCFLSIGHTLGDLLNLSGLHYQIQSWLTKGHEPAALVAAFVHVAANYGTDKPLSYFVKAINTALAKRDEPTATTRTTSGMGFSRGRNGAARNGGFIHHAVKCARRAADG